MSINVLLSLIVLALNGFVLYILHIKKIAVTAIDDSSIRFQEVIKAADFARVSVKAYKRNIFLDANCRNFTFSRVSQYSVR
jgi:hypothetical protein